MFDLLAAGFLLFTILMVLFFMYLGFLHWREENAATDLPKGNGGKRVRVPVEAAARI